MMSAPNPKTTREILSPCERDGRVSASEGRGTGYAMELRFDRRGARPETRFVRPESILIPSPALTGAARPSLPRGERSRRAAFVWERFAYSRVEDRFTTTPRCWRWRRSAHALRSKVSGAASGFHSGLRKNNVRSCVAPPRPRGFFANAPLPRNVCSGRGGWAASNFAGRSRLPVGSWTSFAPRNDLQSNWTAPVTALRPANGATESARLNWKRKVFGSFASGILRSWRIWIGFSIRSCGNLARRIPVGRKRRRNLFVRPASCPHWRCASVSPQGREEFRAGLSGSSRCFLDPPSFAFGRGVRRIPVHHRPYWLTTNAPTRSVPNYARDAAANLSPRGRDGRVAPVRALPTQPPIYKRSAIMPPEEKSG